MSAAYKANKKLLKNIYELLGQSNDSNWDTTAITPETQFMEELGKQIKLAFSDPTKYSVKKIIISTSDEPGEGTKIFQYIRDNVSYHSQSKLQFTPRCRPYYAYFKSPSYIMNYICIGKLHNLLKV